MTECVILCYCDVCNYNVDLCLCEVNQNDCINENDYIIEYDENDPLEYGIKKIDCIT
jgi:hypothetical protein